CGGFAVRTAHSSSGSVCHVPPFPPPTVRSGTERGCERHCERNRERNRERNFEHICERNRTRICECQSQRQCERNRERRWQQATPPTKPEHAIGFVLASHRCRACPVPRGRRSAGAPTGVPSPEQRSPS